MKNKIFTDEKDDKCDEERNESTQNKRDFRTVQIFPNNIVRTVRLYRV